MEIIVINKMIKIDWSQQSVNNFNNVIILMQIIKRNLIKQNQDA